MNLSMPSVSTFKSSRSPRVVLVKAFGHTLTLFVTNDKFQKADKIDNDIVKAFGYKRAKAAREERRVKHYGA